MRQSGILMPVSALPGAYGIGSFSKEAYKFVDWLQKSGQSLWQILPLGPTSYGGFSLPVIFDFCRKSLFY